MAKRSIRFDDVPRGRVIERTEMHAKTAAARCLYESLRPCRTFLVKDRLCRFDHQFHPQRSRPDSERVFEL